MNITEQSIKRQIDELGRVVIPKDIRNQANIRPRDYINISCDNKVVKLEKNALNDKIDNICNLIITHLHHTFKNNIIITDKVKVIKAYGKKVKNLVNKEISNEIIEMLNDNNLSTAVLNSIKITDNDYFKERYYYIPIKEEYYNIGGVFILSDDNKKFNEDVVLFLNEIINN